MMLPREPAGPPPGEWSHRSWSPPAPGDFPASDPGAPVIRRKSFAFGPIPVDEAAGALEDRGPILQRSRFLFFENATTGRGNILYRRHDGHYGLIEPA